MENYAHISNLQEVIKSSWRFWLKSRNWKRGKQERLEDTCDWISTPVGRHQYYRTHIRGKPSCNFQLHTYSLLGHHSQGCPPLKQWSLPIVTEIHVRMWQKVWTHLEMKYSGTLTHMHNLVFNFRGLGNHFPVWSMDPRYCVKGLQFQNDSTYYNISHSLLVMKNLSDSFCSINLK